jgi:hypothetical protein
MSCCAENYEFRRGKKIKNRNIKRFMNYGLRAFAAGDYHEFGGTYRGSVSPARLYGDSDSGRGSIETESHHQVSIL